MSRAVDAPCRAVRQRLIDGVSCSCVEGMDTTVVPPDQRISAVKAPLSETLRRKPTVAGLKWSKMSIGRPSAVYLFR